MVGRYVEELRFFCFELAARRRSLLFDLTGLLFADREGVKLLHGLKAPRAAFTGWLPRSSAADRLNGVFADAEFAHPAAQRVRMQPENSRGAVSAFDHPAGFTEHLLDMLPCHFID